MLPNTLSVINLRNFSKFHDAKHNLGGSCHMYRGAQRWSPSAPLVKLKTPALPFQLKVALTRVTTELQLEVSLDTLIVLSTYA